MLGWIGLWAYNLNSPPSGITQGSFVHEVLTYSFILMAIAIMILYLRNMKNGSWDNGGKDKSSSSTGKPTRGLMDLSSEEYRTYVRSKVRGNRR